MLDIVLPGTGALQPLPDRALACAVLSCRGRSILFDCGEGTQAALRRCGVSMLRIDCIALTHYHGDHTFGLPGLLLSMSMAKRTSPLVIVGPEGLQNAMAPFGMLCPYLPYEVMLVELGEDSLCLHDISPVWPKEAELKAFGTDHSVISQGYVFSLGRAGKFLPEKAAALNVPKNLWGELQHGSSVEVDGNIVQPEEVLGEKRRGLKVVYTGDTGFCDAIIENAWQADLLISEATYGNDDQAQDRKHMTFAQAALIARDAEVRELWLTHYSPMVTDPAEFHAEATAIFENTLCGEDGMHRQLSFSELGLINKND